MRAVTPPGAAVSGPFATRFLHTHHKEPAMHQIVYIVGAVVIVIAVLSLVGLA